jgi:hypothetical protein
MSAPVDFPISNHDLQDSAFSIYEASMKKLMTSLSFIVLLALLAAGCSDDDHPTVTPPDRISSPDDVMDAFTAALEAMDLVAMEALLERCSGRFRFLFRDEDVAKLSLPTVFLDRGDMMRAWRNVFAGERIFNHAGQWAPGVEAIEVTRFERNTEWCEPICGGSSWWDLQFGVLRVNFRIEMTVTRAGDLPPLVIKGNLEVGVRPPGDQAVFGGDCEGYALYDMTDGSWEPAGENQVTLGEFLYGYFTNVAPEAALAVEHDIGGDPLLVEASACASTDFGEPALGLTYSWRNAPEAVWTAGSEQCTRQFDVPGVGSWYLEVEVRDRWGLADRANLTLTWMH